MARRTKERVLKETAILDDPPQGKLSRDTRAKLKVVARLKPDAAARWLPVLRRMVLACSEASHQHPVEVMVHLDLLTESELNDFDRLRRLDFWAAHEPANVRRTLTKAADPKNAKALLLRLEAALLRRYRPALVERLLNAKPSELKGNPAVLYGLGARAQTKRGKRRASIAVPTSQRRRVA